MNISKFLSLLVHRALWFTRLDGDDIEDKWEGRYPPRRLREYLATLPEPDRERRRESILAQNENERKMSVVNCWHCNEYESAAMWGLYGGDQSVAVTSTIGSLKLALQSSQDRVFIGQVEYRDVEREDIPPDKNVFQTILRKRLSFAHEREVRAIQWLVLSPLTVWDDVGSPSNPGVYSSVDLSALILQVYLAPASAPWLKDVVADLLARYGLASVELVRSAIDDPYMV